MNTLLKKVLVVSSAKDLDFIRLAEELGTEQYQVTRVEDVQQAREEMERRGLPHLLLVDLLWGLNTLEFCEEMYDPAGMPIIIIAANGDTQVAVEALGAADDYVRREYGNSPELVTRIRRVMTRVANFAYARGPEIMVGDRLSIDQMNRQVIVDGEVRKLTPTENALLGVLLAHRGEVVDADTLVEEAWRVAPAVEDRNALRVHIHRLRHKLEEDPDQPKIIKTERGTGYSFAE